MKKINLSNPHIEALEPYVEMLEQGNAKDNETWTLVRKLVHTMEFTANPGRNLKFYVKDKPTGKILGIICIFFVEKAMISLLKTKSKLLWENLSLLKLILALVLEIGVFCFVDMSQDHSIGLRVPAINSTIGFVFSLVVLGNKYRKEIDKNFIFMIYGVLLLIPSGLFISFKINIHPWFDKNDFGHLILIIAMFFYYKSIYTYSQKIVNKQ